MIILNLIFTPIIGPLGAAIATATSYYIVLIIRIYQVKRYIKLRIRMMRDNISYLLLVIQGTMFLIFSDSFLLYSILLVSEIIMVFLYKKEIVEIFSKIRSKYNR